MGETLRASDAPLYLLTLLTEVPEFGSGPEVLGKVLFIRRQAWANQTSVREVEAKLLHFLFRSIRRPTLPSHAEGCNHHSRAIVTYMAVDENLLTRIVLNQPKELRKRFVFRKRALPGHWHILHSQMRHQLALTFARSAQVHHNVDAHFCQGVKSLFGGLATAV